MKGGLDVQSAATDDIIRWLAGNRDKEHQSHLQGRRTLRTLVADAEAELERRGVIHAVSADIESVAVRDEKTGPSDLWKVYLDSQLFGRVVDALSEPYAEEQITKVIGVEARGLPLAGALAIRLGAGFVPVRKAGGFLPEPVIGARADGDYLGRNTELVMQTDALRKQDRVLIVDDWAETGSHLKAVVELVESRRAQIVGVALIIDQLENEVRRQLPQVRALVRYLPMEGSNKPRR